jgi:hypothetical protein
MTHAADALTISDEHRLKKRNQELETEQSEELRQVKYELQTLKGDFKKLSEDWILFSKPHWDMLQTRRPDLMKLLRDEPIDK